MTVTLAIPQQIEQELRKLANNRGVSLEELGTQALAAGLRSLASAQEAADMDKSVLQAARRTLGMKIAMSSPLTVQGYTRERRITIEPAETATDAH